VFIEDRQPPRSDVDIGVADDSTNDVVAARTFLNDSDDRDDAGLVFLIILPLFILVLTVCRVAAYQKRLSVRAKSSQQRSLEALRSAHAHASAAGGDDDDDDGNTVRFANDDGRWRDVAEPTDTDTDRDVPSHVVVVSSARVLATFICVLCTSFVSSALHLCPLHFICVLCTSFVFSALCARQSDGQYATVQPRFYSASTSPLTSKSDP
jgi:hypothetical protein